MLSLCKLVWCLATACLRAIKIGAHKISCSANISKEFTSLLYKTPFLVLVCCYILSSTLLWMRSWISTTVFCHSYSQCLSSGPIKSDLFDNPQVFEVQEICPTRTLCVKYLKGKLRSSASNGSMPVSLAETFSQNIRFCWTICWKLISDGWILLTWRTVYLVV
jgi:hypothetical protein